MRKLIIGTAALAVLFAGGGVAVAAGHDDGGPLPPEARQRATTAALDATGGGRVNSVERDSENGATWEVEVTRPDGTTVDVRLDARYRVVVVEGDHEDSSTG
jgi:uncharacterized membrane protein YkoI